MKMNMEKCNRKRLSAKIAAKLLKILKSFIEDANFTVPN